MYLILLLGASSAVRAQVTATPVEELVVELNLNGQAGAGMLVVLRDGTGGYWIDAAELERLRLLPPPGVAREHQGQRYLPLAGYAGADLRYDATMAMLFLQLPPGAFRPVHLSADRPEIQEPGTAATGLFTNYQLFADRIDGQQSAGSLTELGLFSRLGVLTSTTATRHAAGSSSITRLDTALTRDFPARLQTLTLGDAISDPGAFGSALRFAGVRLERNFAMRPELVTAPLLVASGTAVVPSAVDVFVNSQRVHTAQVLPGPFVIDSLPTVTGAGDVRVVVRDATGREQVLVQPFYSSPQLLARGLNQYSFSAGRVREDYTGRSFSYGSYMASGTLRRGLTDHLTLEGHGEFLRRQGWNTGAQLASRLGSAGIASFSAAVGGDALRSGWLAGAGFDRQSPQGSFGLQLSLASAGYRRAGEIDDPGARQKLRATVQFGRQLGALGSATLALTEQRSQDGAQLSSISLAHSMRVGRQGFLSLNVNHVADARRATSAFLLYTQSFGPARTFSAGAEGGIGRGAARQEMRATVAQATPAGTGQGWRLSAARSGSYDAWWQQRFALADVELQAARNFGQDGQSVQLRGGASWLGGQFHGARAVDGSFAIVEVGGIPDVPVYLENRLVARTDAHGRAVLPNLLSYEANRIRVDAEDLPLDVAMTSGQLEVRPAWRSGVVVRFPVQRIAPAVFRLRLPDGRFVPAGAEVQLNGGHFPVANDGYTYVTTLDHGVAGSARWAGSRCTFRVDPPPSDDPLPDMGEIICRPAAGAER